MKIHLIPGYPDTSEFLRSRIAIIARIPGYIYPDISPDTIHQPDGGIWTLNNRVSWVCCGLTFWEPTVSHDRFWICFGRHLFLRIDIEDPST